MSTTIGGFLAGGVAACGAVTVTHPFETIKTRLQLQGELAAKSETKRLYTGVFQGVRVIVTNEGLRGLMAGLGAAYCYQILLNGCRLGFYEPIRAALTKAVHGTSATQSGLINIISGASSGILGAAIGSPFFLIKTRLQSYSPFLPVGTQHNYRGATDGFKRIYKSEGIKGLYRGVGAAMVRTGFGSSVQLPTYYVAKRRLEKYAGMKDTPALHLTASAASGFVVCCVMHPPDTVMSRMYNQSGNLYTGIWDCVSKTVRTEGLLAIYKGYFAHLARILPHTILTLTLAEQTNKIVRQIEERLFLD